jgi:LssY-like putative type I secretion system component LssY
LAVEDHDMSERPDGELVRRRSARGRLGRTLAALLLLYVAATYLAAPALWRGYAHWHPALENLPGITYTASGIHGDPLNVVLIGTKNDVMKIMVAARWYPADPLSFKSCLEIAEATVLKRPYGDAPVSSLYLFGRKEDLAFEQPVGRDPRERHHVRFWLSEKVDPDGRPVWIGAAVFDQAVGFSRTTGEITHHTAADVDAERDYLFRDLQATGDVVETYIVDGFHTQLTGRNGGGDPWHTDGRLFAAVLRSDDASPPPLF